MRNKFPKTISDETMKEIVARKKNGEDTEEVAREFKISTASVANIYRNWRVLGVLKSYHIKEVGLDFVIQKCERLQQENDELKKKIKILDKKK